MRKKNYYHLLHNTVVAALLFLFLFSTPLVADDLPCPTPAPGDTEEQLPYEDQNEIPSGTCKWVEIEGKLRYENVTLSLDQTVGSGFHFNQNNGPTTIQTTDNRVLVCSDGTSCGSSSIILSQNGNDIEIGSVRSDKGYWIFKDNSCALSGPKTGMYGNAYVIERGGHKVIQRYDETWSISTMNYEYMHYCNEGTGDCPTRCQTDTRCDETFGCVECIDFEMYPDWEGDFPCKDDHHIWSKYHVSTLKCFCTISLQHYVFKCTSY